MCLLDHTNFYCMIFKILFSKYKIFEVILFIIISKPTVTYVVRNQSIQVIIHSTDYTVKPHAFELTGPLFRLNGK